MTPIEKKKLHALNALLGAATGSDPETVSQLARVIEFSRRSGGVSRDYRSLGEIAKQLVAVQAGRADRFHFEHCELDELSVSPLWLPQRLKQHLVRLRGANDGLLLVTGLRQALCPKGKRFGPEAQRQYRQTVANINRIAAGCQTSGSRLQVIIL